VEAYDFEVKPETLDIPLKKIAPALPEVKPAPAASKTKSQP